MKAANKHNELALSQLASNIFELEGENNHAPNFYDYPVCQLPNDTLTGDQQWLKM